MINQNGYIPDRFRSRWEEADQNLAKSTEKLNKAYMEHNAAVLARIALNTELESWHRQQAHINHEVAS